MKPQNIYSVLQGAAALESLGDGVDKKYKPLKKHEIRTMALFCTEMQNQGCQISHFDGFYVGYTIQQINKEFDLLRFSSNYVLNIEVKSELKIANKEDKILRQLQKNYYYLHFLGKELRLFTFEENNGFYKYDGVKDQLIQVTANEVASAITCEQADLSIDPDTAFVPSNYLISPFNSTEKFIQNEYFLTQAQDKIRAEIDAELLSDPTRFFCISAHAGTGKTLLLYDLAKYFMNNGKQPLIIHCGMLNSGHECLRDKYHWNIVSIRAIDPILPITVMDNADIVLVDESQRIRKKQLDALIKKARGEGIPCIFSYDTKQFLRTGESCDIADYLGTNYPDIVFSRKHLTSKIRTNKFLASFIVNLMNIGKETANTNYECVSIDYMESTEKLFEYLEYLKSIGWIPITYTTSQYNLEPYDYLVPAIDKNAHAVIGQEFSKVVFVMDKNFYYTDDGKLVARQSYYSASGMLYQIVTRVVDELKIIVLDNPALFLQLQKIKAMGM